MYQHQCLSVTQTEVASSNTVGVILKPAALKIFMESRDAMYGDDIVAIKVNGVEKEVEDMALFIMNRKVGQEIMVTVQPA